jgi:hypothetical protein
MILILKYNIRFPNSQPLYCGLLVFVSKKVLKVPSKRGKNPVFYADLGPERIFNFKAP